MSEKAGYKTNKLNLGDLTDFVFSPRVSAHMERVIESLKTMITPDSTDDEDRQLIRDLITKTNTELVSSMPDEDVRAMLCEMTVICGIVTFQNWAKGRWQLKENEALLKTVMADPNCPKQLQQLCRDLISIMEKANE